MDGNNWRAQAQGGEGTTQAATGTTGPMDSADWRTQLLPDSRQRIVNKIMETLKRHLPVSGQEGVQELKKIAVRFEEKIYTAATSQQDYLRKISLKMLKMETKSQNPMSNSILPNAASSGQNAHGPASLDSTAQMGNANGADWQEEIYQKIKSMREIYLSELNDLFLKIASKVQQDNSCKFFRWRDEEIDPRSKFILPRLVNKFKEMDEELAQIELNKRQFMEMEEGLSKYKTFNKKNIEMEESLFDKMKKEKKNKSRVCCLNWKYVLCIMVVVLVWCMKFQVKDGECNCSYLELA